MFGCDGALNIIEETRPPGWVELGMEFSLGVDPVYPKDRAVTAAIEALDETFVPLMVRWTFLAPADAQTSARENHTFRFHGIGRTGMAVDTRGLSPDEAAEGDDLLRLKNLEVPPGYSGRIPRYLDPTVGILDDPKYLGLEQRFAPATEAHGASDLPGSFIPWDWDLYTALRRSYTREHTPRDLVESQLLAPIRKREKRKQAARDDFAREFVGFQRWAQKRLDTASDAEHMAQFESRKRAAMMRMAAQMQRAISFKLHGVS